MKKCTDCGGFKEYRFFYKNKNMGDGYLNQCKSCSTIRNPSKGRKENPMGYPRWRMYPLNLIKKGLAMRRQGFSYRVIEAELGIPESGLANYVTGDASLKPLAPKT